MDILYRPPMDYEAECAMLEKNYVTCLSQKAQNDVGVPMKCNVERVRDIQILWFNVDCPTRFERFTSEDGLREVYQEWKAGKYEEED